MKASDCSGRTLAFLGDAVWSLLVREYLIAGGQGRGDQMQRLSIGYVSAKAQSSFYRTLHAQGFFTEAEEEVYRRGRNASAGSVPHSTSVADYRSSTGFEAVLGWLHMEQKQDRIRQIWDQVRTPKEG